jgi:signal transduction histidine kinase
MLEYINSRDEHTGTLGIFSPMSQPGSRPLPLLLAVTFLGGLTIGSLLTATPVRNRVPISAGIFSTLRDVVGIGSLSLYVAVLAFPLFLWMARRWPLVRGRLRLRVPLYLAVIGAGLLLPGALAYWFRAGPLGTGPGFAASLVLRLVSDAIPLIGVAALAQAIDLTRRQRQTEAEAARLRAEFAEARLGRLTDQLQPHFLFNSLQAISTLLHRDPIRADEVLGHLSLVLRGALDRGDRPIVSLAEELELVRPYLDLVQARFGDRLAIDVDVSPELLSLSVPPLFLQPLVENAVEHGVERSDGPARIRIEGRREVDSLRLSVLDNGPGPSTDRRGIGLRNTRDRIVHLFGPAATIELTSVETGGAEARIRLPVIGAPR